MQSKHPSTFSYRRNIEYIVYGLTFSASLAIWPATISAPIFFCFCHTLRSAPSIHSPPKLHDPGVGHLSDSGCPSAQTAPPEPSFWPRLGVDRYPWRNVWIFCIFSPSWSSTSDHATRDRRDSHALNWPRDTSTYTMSHLELAFLLFPRAAENIRSFVIHKSCRWRTSFSYISNQLWIKWD